MKKIEVRFDQHPPIRTTRALVNIELSLARRELLVKKTNAHILIEALRVTFEVILDIKFF